MKTFFLSLLLFLLGNVSFACDFEINRNIRPVFDSAEYNGADLIFLGELISRDTINGSYSFKVLELFKGQLSSKDSIIYGFAYSSCSGFPHEYGKWIVYTNWEKNKTTDFFTGSRTRALEWPYFLGSMGYYEGKLNNDLTWDEKRPFMLSAAKKDWYRELKQLRKLKKKKK